MIYKFIKRVIDIVLSIIGIIILSPILLLVAIAIKIESNGPILFLQERIGKNGKIFKIYKFRSMVVGAEKMGSGVYSGKNDARVTKVGKIIRATSIDELPQLFNIIKGDMSIIGPRPVLTYHPWKYDEYTDQQKKRFNVRPGVTGWAQVNGRKDVEWHKRIELDVEYVENMSLWFDIKIFLKTIKKVILMEDNLNVSKTINKQQLKLMYITNNEEVAKIAENSGVDRIFIDLEINGKEERQGHLDTVISKHNITDVEKIKKVLKKSELLVRVNPIYENSKNEIDSVINQGANIVMLPFFKTPDEVKKFIELVDKRATTCLLLETPEAVECLDEILEIKGIDEIHIGLNDLHLGYKMNFMFELLANGTVEKICKKINEKNILYGFGGIARVGSGTLPAEHIIIEHVRIGSSMVILSRSFCNTKEISNMKEIEEVFEAGVKDIRKIENEAKSYTEEQFKKNTNAVKQEVESIVESITIKK